LRNMKIPYDHSTDLEKVRSSLFLDDKESRGGGKKKNRALKVAFGSIWEHQVVFRRRVV